MSVMTTDLRIYRLQIMNFLQSMTIKFAPFADALNNLVVQSGYEVDENNPQTWKYYLNMIGSYHASDTMMTITSLDTHQTIDFTIENLNNHVRTKAAYVPGSTYYDALCERYPAQSDLIKSIVFPVRDINTAIDAPDLTLLGYEGSYLEDSEEGYLVQATQKILSFLSNRWDMSYLASEPYYYVTYWGLMWNALAQGLQAFRFQAIRSIYAHSWSVWQYLTSNGIGDYSDILSRKQEMFFYRNFRYLQANRGRQSNLKLLNDNILNEMSIGLYGRDVYQQTLDGSTSYQLIPEFVAREISAAATTDASVPAMGMAELNSRLVEAGDETNSSAEYVQYNQALLGATPLNTYPTKILELRPLPRDRKYADLFNNFVIDSLVYLVNNGYYNTTVALYTSQNSESIILSAKQALVLWYYCIQRMKHETPIDLPVHYTSRTAFRQSQDLLPIPSTFKWSGFTYNTKQYINPDGWTAQGAYPAAKLTKSLDFSNLISDMFLRELDLVLLTRHSSDLVTLAAMHMASSCIFLQETIPLTLQDTTETTYDQWFAEHYDIFKHFVTPYETLSNPQASYDALATQIISQLVPITNIMTTYGNFAVSDQGYARLKQLFISLCSYNVTFLDANRDVYQFFFIEEQALGSISRTYSGIVPLPMQFDVEISTVASNSMSITFNDTQISLATKVSGSLGVGFIERMSVQTTASDKVNTTDAVNVQLQASTASQVIGVNILDSVSVGLSTQ